MTFVPPIAVQSGLNGIVAYGQSNACNVSAPPINVTQPYRNKTFSVFGPQLATGYIAGPTAGELVEISRGTGLDQTGGAVGETLASGTANQAVASYLAESDGLSPEDRAFFAFVSGLIGAPITDLVPGSPPYNALLGYIGAAKNIADHNGQEFAMAAHHYIQGEKDNHVPVITPEEYAAALIGLAQKLSLDVCRITKQGFPLHTLIAQAAAYSSDLDDPPSTLGQMQAIAENPLVHLCCPTYMIPVDAGGVHYTNVGRALLGAYFGRATHQMLGVPLLGIPGRRPDCIWPEFASINALTSGSTLTIRFRVPVAPLVLDADVLNAVGATGLSVSAGVTGTAGRGFLPFDDGGPIPLSSIAVGGDGRTVKMVIARDVVGGVEALNVSYGVKGGGGAAPVAPGLALYHGGSGNLRDSTTDTATISGTSWPLWHLCPLFRIKVGLGFEGYGAGAYGSGDFGDAT